MTAMPETFDIAIIGGGILGTSLSYFLSALGSAGRVAVIEQAPRVAFHTSGRNTGEVHAPYLYDPRKKRLFAKAAFHGYEMWEEYSKMKGLPFKKGGVVEVASDEKDIAMLEKYMRWGVENGLREGSDIRMVSGGDLRKVEPEVRCKAALVVRREGSVDYAVLTGSLMEDSASYGTAFILGARAVRIDRTGDGWSVLVADADRGGRRGAGSRAAGMGTTDATTTSQGREIRCRFLINAAGGESVDVAHRTGLAEDLTDVHFRGEYWRAPPEYSGLTRTSIYSVPEFPDYPFLDPHWIVRVDGSCEVGPNAVPVFSPYGYDRAENIRTFLPKTLELLGSGAAKAALDRRLQSLVLNEMHSSLSKPAMIRRVKKFLPRIDPGKFTEKGVAGIRSSVIGSDGRFVPDVIMISDKSGQSFHILNYNSPGATGVLPFSVHIVEKLQRAGVVGVPDRRVQCGPWKFEDVAEKLCGGRVG
ncbi:MAG: FAD-dependent oxidoreductase [Thaumarchaeota archaeon]|nr:FAD-dependent oxidoreductase [Nitrososphaerota archaeon]